MFSFIKLEGTHKKGDFYLEQLVLCKGAMLMLDKF